MKLYRAVAWLHQRFVVEGKSVAEMAREAGASEMTVRRALEEKGFIKK